MTMYDKQWTIEQHFADLEKKKLALRKITEYHEEEAAKSRARERHLVETHLSIATDLIDGLWWEIDDIECALNERDSLFFIKEQVKRNELWSEWVDKRLEIIRLMKLERELEACLEAL